MRILYWIYCLVLIIATPILILILIYRGFKGKEDFKRLNEKFGIPSVKLPKGQKVAWFHGASVGETKALLKLMEDFKHTYPDMFVLVTSGTVTSSKLMKKELDPKIGTHQFTPLDHPVFVALFLMFWKPVVCFRADSDLWPVTVEQIRKRKILHYIVNGRISDNSMKTYGKMPFYAKFLLAGVTKVFAKDEIDAEKFKKLGAKEVTTFGNLKLDADVLTYDKKEFDKFSSVLKEKTVVIFASTSDNEEDMAFKIFNNLNKKFKDLFFIIAPRQRTRLPGIINNAKKNNINLAIRSQKQEIKKDTNVYISDTIGEMGLFFSLSEFAFMGRSMFGGFMGSNPIEPLQLGCIVLTGPHIMAFEALYNNMIKSGVVDLCKTPADLEERLAFYLGNKSGLKKAIENNKQFLEQNKNVGKKILNNLKPVLDKIDKKR